MENETEATPKKYNWKNYTKKSGRMEIRISEETKAKLDILVALEQTDRTKVIESLINKSFENK